MAIGRHPLALPWQMFGIVICKRVVSWIQSRTNDLESDYLLCSDWRLLRCADASMFEKQGPIQFGLMKSFSSPALFQLDLDYLAGMYVFFWMTRSNQSLELQEGTIDWYCFYYFVMWNPLILRVEPQRFDLQLLSWIIFKRFLMGANCCCQKAWSICMKRFSPPTLHGFLPWSWLAYPPFMHVHQ